MTLTLKTLHDLAGFEGQELGCSDWLMIDQTLIQQFAEATGDDNWYHLDTSRAAVELPGGKTIAHGLLLLSLVPRLSRDFLVLTEHGRALNYGYDKVRFIRPVERGDRVRIRVALNSLEQRPNGVMVRRQCLAEVQDSLHPAMIADMLTFLPHSA